MQIKNLSAGSDDENATAKPSLSLQSNGSIHFSSGNFHFWPLIPAPLLFRSVSRLVAFAGERETTLLGAHLFSPQIGSNYMSQD
jgi:hypothetical protein